MNRDKVAVEREKASTIQSALKEAKKDTTIAQNAVKKAKALLDKVGTYANEKVYKALLAKFFSKEKVVQKLTEKLTASKAKIQVLKSTKGKKVVRGGKSKMRGGNNLERILVIGSSGNIAPTLIKNIQSVYEVGDGTFYPTKDTTDAECKQLAIAKSSNFNLMTQKGIEELEKFIQLYTPTITIFVAAVREPKDFAAANIKTDNRHPLFNLNYTAPVRVYKTLQTLQTLQSLKSADYTPKYVFISSIYVFKGDSTNLVRKPVIDKDNECNDYVDITNNNNAIGTDDDYLVHNENTLTWDTDLYAKGKRLVELRLNQLYKSPKVPVSIIRMDGVLNEDSNDFSDNTFLNTMWTYLEAKHKVPFNDTALSKLVEKYPNEIRYPVTSEEVSSAILHSIKNMETNKINVYHVAGFFSKGGVTKAELIQTFDKTFKTDVRSDAAKDRKMVDNSGIAEYGSFNVKLKNTFNKILNAKCTNYVLDYTES